MTKTQDGTLFRPENPKLRNKQNTVVPHHHSPELTSKVYTILRDHLGVLISGTLVAFAALKIIIFARGDYSIALAVLSAGQQFTILASTMFNILTILATLYVSWSSTTKVRATSSDSFEFHLAHNIKSYLPFLMAWMLLFVLAPAIFIALALFSALSNYWTNLRSRRGRRKEPDRRRIARYRLKRTRRLRIIGIVVSINIVVMIVVLAASDWVPTERVTFKEDQSETTITGLVVGQQGKQVLIVRSDRGAAFWVGEDSLKRRRLCTPDDTPWEGISQPPLDLISTFFESKKPAPRCSAS